EVGNGLVVGDGGEPVGAQQHGVAGDKVVRGDVEVHLTAHAERLGEDVLHGPHDAAFFGVGPLAVGQRVVASQLGYAPAAEDIEAAIADVAVGELSGVSSDEGGDRGGAHARVFVLGHGPCEEGAVRAVGRGGAPVGVQ